MNKEKFGGCWKGRGMNEKKVGGVAGKVEKYGWLDVCVWKDRWMERKGKVEGLMIGLING
jgi:hypothetical protein